MNATARKAVRLAVVGAAALLLAIQLVPYGRDHSNPPVAREPDWDSPRTLELARRACFDCHSHETHWPWYSNIAPMSWLVYRDVSDGRHDLNFSNWRGGKKKNERPEKMEKEISKAKMPPPLYRFAHPDARLTKEERRELIRGLSATANGQSSEK